MRASAPGKVLWAGEYAVLEGHPAVLSAVDRRVVATRGPDAVALSPFLEALRAELGDEVRRVTVDSSALGREGKKLGLGSSAAAVVATTALVLGPDAGVDRIHAVAHRAHAAAQGPRGARGSGADVAASVHGGLVQVTRTGDETPMRVERLRAEAPPFCLLWTGAPADTPTLVAQVRAFAGRDAAAHADRIDALGAIARRLGAALVAGDAPAVIAAVADGAAALAALAAASGAPLVPPGFAAIQTLAGRYQGAAKPTGAGGGDLILAVFADRGARDAFASAAELRGMIPVSANVDPQGVLAEPPGSA